MKHETGSLAASAFAKASADAEAMADESADRQVFVTTSIFICDWGLTIDVNGWINDGKTARGKCQD